MKVELIYYKPNGKFYSEAFYQTSEEFLFEIWAQVEAFQNMGILPGLVEGAGKDFFISVDVPEHLSRHPHLIVPR